MTIHTDYIGDYRISYDDQENDKINVEATDNRNESYGPIPTEEECNAKLGTQNLPIDLYHLFTNCANLKVSPKLPEKVYSLGNAGYGCFEGCSSLLIAPALSKELTRENNYRCANCFLRCSSLVYPAVIPKTAIYANHMYNQTAIYAPVSIPNNVTSTYYMYSNSKQMSGEFCIRPMLSEYSGTLRYTEKPITIYGDQALCEAVAATANNGNASWQPWYDPVPAVTDRGQGSYTTADDMTRMVRNGVLAVDTYAPGRMVYHRGDIVRQDEWEALVEAAQTIDPTVTMSTHYTNLNKIEKAFDDAL